MAVPEQTPYIEHTGNGITTSFALGFQCETKDHLIVLVDDIEPPIATWSLTGGNVVFTTAPAAGKKITLQRNTPFSRTVDYQSYNNSFRPPAVNKDFDWIWWKLQELGVADWILGARIDALKNYVDRKDDELKAYLMEEIRKQGVALDQLDEYYNYLMQQLAQVAINKGWNASFIVSADGSTQQQINDRIGNTWYEKPLGYELNDRVMLKNGDIVRNDVPNNTADPNSDMTGWVKTNSASQFWYNDYRKQDDKNQETISVLDHKNLAIGDYWTDAFNKAISDALAWGINRILVPNIPKYYVVKDITIPRGIELVGIGRKRVYNPTSLSHIEGSCAIVFDPTGTFCMDFRGLNHVENINFHGYNRSCAGVGISETNGLNFQNVSMVAFDNGFGLSSGYIKNSRFWNCHATKNNNGVRNSVDSHYYGGEFNDNLNIGVAMGSGANDNTFVGCKNEWNVLNWQFYQATNNNIVGGVTDRARSKYNFSVKQSYLTVNGTICRRAGASDDLTSAHFLLSDNSILSLNGVITRTGANDGGSGLTTPAYIFDVENDSGAVVVSGGDLTGSTIGLSRGGTLDVKYSGVKGVKNTEDLYGEKISTITSSQSDSMNVATGAILNTNSPRLLVFKINVSSRNASSGAVAYNDFIIQISRASSGVAAANILKVDDAESTAINQTSASLNVSVANVSENGSNFDVIFTSTISQSIQLRANAKLVM